jgi:hypothetical protein
MDLPDWRRLILHSRAFRVAGQERNAKLVVCKSTLAPHLQLPDYRLNLDLAVCPSLDTSWWSCPPTLEMPIL